MTGRTPLTPSKTRRGRKHCGQSLVEFALCAPIFFILVFGIVDFGMGLRAWIAVTNSAREGARYGAVTCATSDADEDKVVTAVKATAGGLAITDVTVTNCPGNSTDYIKVEVEYEYEFITPLGGMLSIFGGGLPDSVTLTSVSDMRLE